MNRPQNIPPVQQSFLGASIRSFSGEIGWNETPTTLNINLVEDKRINELFDGPLVGSPVEFNFRKDPLNPDPDRDFYFAGILNRKDSDNSESGNRLISVTLADPRVFLDGVQLILNDFTKPIIGIDNIYNIFAYYEDDEYGSSLVNSLGMKSELIYDALSLMINSAPIKFGLSEYFIDLTEIPRITDDYRITQNIISLSSFISDCCEIANLDYLCELVRSPGFGWVIKFRTVQRGYVPQPGSLINFLDNIEDVNKKSFGIEYNYQATRSKVIIGAKVDLLLFQNSTMGSILGSGSSPFVVNPEDDEDNQITIQVPNTTRIDNGNIAKFWGEDSNGNLIYSRLNPTSIDQDDEVVVVPAYEIGFPYYVMSMGELRAATISQDAWESYIALNDYPGSIHENKATILRIKAEVRDALRNLFANKKLEKINTNIIIDLYTKTQFNDESRAFVEKIYSFIRRYATEYFGVKYSVSIPNVKIKVNPDNFRDIVTSIITNDSGYLSDEEIFSVVLAGLMPENFYFVQNDDGKITSYVKYNNYNDLALTNLTPGEDYVIDYDFVRGNGSVSLSTSVYLRCTIDEKIYFGNRAFGSDARVVITLPGPVYRGKDIKTKNNILADAYFKSRGAKLRDENGDPIGPQDQIDLATKIRHSIIGSDALLFDSEPYPQKPVLAVVPLRDTLNTYGPWQAGGESGKVEIEQNEDMAPWNFGGYQNMNIVGDRLVRDILIQSVENEIGSVDIPGVYNIGPGTQIPNDGPYINGFNVNIGSEGITTSFRYGKPEIRTGKMLEYQISRIKKELDLRKSFAKTKKDVYKKLLDTQQIPTSLKKKDNKPQRRVRPNSSSPIIMGQSLDQEDSDKLASIVATMPGYNVGQFIAEEFDKKAGMSLDGLFRPYEVNGDGLVLPVYNLDPIPEDPAPPSPGDPEPEEDNFAFIDSRTLFPFSKGHDISVVFKGDEPTEDIQNDVFKEEEELPEGVDPPEYNEDVRPLSLKGPVIISGWGYDINGRPVPNENENNPTEKFLEDHLVKNNEWKVGPTDLRWDHDRKVWSGGTFMMEGILDSDIEPAPIWGEASEFFILPRVRSQGTGTGWRTVERLKCFNRDTQLSATGSTGGHDTRTYVIVAFINSEWRPIWVSC